MQPLNLQPDAPWKERFRATKILWAALAEARPERGLVCSNASGAPQLYAWEVATGNLHQVTNAPTGVWRGAIAARGDFIYYLNDDRGNEVGHFVRLPFAGGDIEDLTPDLPPYAAFSFRDNATGDRLGFCAATRDGFHVYIIERHDSGRLTAPRLLWHSLSQGSVPCFSYSGELVAIATNERSGTKAYNLVFVDTASGEIIGELWEPGTSISFVRFAPHPGDARLLAVSDQSGFTRPFIWNPLTQIRQDLILDTLEGSVDGWDWHAESDRLLLTQRHRAQEQLFLYDLKTNTFEQFAHPNSTFNRAQFTPSGTVLATCSNSTHPPCVIELDGQIHQTPKVVIAPSHVPPTQPWRSVTFPSTDGVAIQAWLALPGLGMDSSVDGALGETFTLEFPSVSEPLPTILHVHGGPTSVTQTAFSAIAQTWLDHGFVWISVNYRGSTTFGKEFEQAIWGNLGQLEVEDMVAARTWLVEQGISDPNRFFVTGGSYGGYLTLLALGKYPTLWAGGMADVAIADWFLMYEDQAETLRAAQRALFKGTPAEKSEAHRVASPITYAEQVKAPLLVIQGRNDTRCPARQMQVYEEKLKSLGKSIQVHWFDAGHLAGDIEQNIHHQELKLQFVNAILQHGS